MSTLQRPTHLISFLALSFLTGGRRARVPCAAGLPRRMGKSGGRGYMTLSEVLARKEREEFLSTSKSSPILQPLPTTSHPTRPKQTYSFPRPPQTVLLVRKPGDDRTKDALALVIRYIQQRWPGTGVMIESNSVEEMREAGLEGLVVVTKDDKPHLPTSTSLLISLGGDGTVLHLSSLFDSPAEVPPVVGFSMGSLGFLLPFHIDNYEEVIGDVFEGRFGLLNRMRLACEVFGEDGAEISRCPNTGWQVMNEVALHRGRYPHLSLIDAYIDGQHLTEAVADGLILATPTGSTAYSLSSGGPIAHPNVNCFLLTPIAPRSLSFRTLLVDGGVEVVLKISKNSRAPSELSMDGREVCILSPGEYIKVTKSKYPIPCVTRREGGDDWVGDIK